MNQSVGHVELGVSDWAADAPSSDDNAGATGARQDVHEFANRVSLSDSVWPRIAVCVSLRDVVRLMGLAKSVRRVLESSETVWQTQWEAYACLPDRVTTMTDSDEKRRGGAAHLLELYQRMWQSYRRVAVGSDRSWTDLMAADTALSTSAVDALTEWARTFRYALEMSARREDVASLVDHDKASRSASGWSQAQRVTTRG
jgi:hypothetical protein